MGKDGKKGRGAIVGTAAELGLPTRAEQGQPRASPYTFHRDVRTPKAKPSLPLN